MLGRWHELHYQALTERSLPAAGTWNNVQKQAGLKDGDR